MRDDLQSSLLQISQNDWQVTKPMFESNQLYSQATEKMPVPFQQTAEQETNQTHQPPRIEESVKVETQSNRSFQSKNFFALAVAALLLLCIGGGYYLLTNAAKTPPATNQNSTENLEDVQLINFNKGGKYGFSDINKKLIIEAKYDDAYNLSEGLIRVMQKKKWGFIDKTGNTVIPLKFDYASDFYEGLAVVKLNGKWGYIDKTGSVVFPIKYDEAGDFSEGLAFVKLNGERSFIDKSGEQRNFSQI